MALDIIFVKLGCWQPVFFLRVTRVFIPVVEKGLVRVPQPAIPRRIPSSLTFVGKTYCLQSDINYLKTESDGKSQIEASPY